MRKDVCNKCINHLKKVQAIAKGLKKKDPSLKHTQAVSLAWKQIKGGEK